FDPEELAREIEVVCEEIKRSHDSPARRLSKELFAAAFERHPYGRPVIATPESVRSLSREKILRFYRRWYQAGNCTLVAVGDVHTDDVLNAAEALFRFSTHPGVPALAAPLSFLPAPARPKEPERTRARIRVLEAPQREAYVSIGWPAPHQHHADVAALDALALVLTHGEAARLHKALMRTRRLVSDVQASAYTPRDPGLSVISMTLQPQELREAVAETLRQVEHLRHEAVSEDELAIARHILESDAVYQRETVQGQARKLGFWESDGGGVEAEARYFARLAALEVDELRAVAERHFKPEQMVVTAIVPQGALAQHGLGEDELRPVIERVQAEPRPAPVQRVVRERSARAPMRVAGPPESRPLQRVQLPGGGVLLLKQDRAVPLFALRAVWNGGLRFEREETSGAQMMLARLVAQGTQRRDAEQLSLDMERMGGQLGGNAGRNSFGLRLEALTRHQDEAIELFAEALCEPAFAHDEVERERELQLEELLARDDNPGGVAFRLFETTLWRAHPYRLDVLGTQASLAAITAQSLAAQRERLYVPAGATIAAVGDFDAERLARVLTERVRATSERAQVRPSPVQEPLLLAPRAAIRTLEKAQAHLVVGFPGITLSDPRRPALELLASSLSGQGGRLFVELRDKQSLAYSVSAFSMEGVDPGAFAIHLACGPEKTARALAGIRRELARCRDELLSAAELDKAKTHLIGAQAIGLQRASARAALFAFDECYGLGAEASLEYPAQIAAVTADAVREAARELLEPSREVIALVCPEGAAPAELSDRARIGAAR
ncbi:MAG: insulinase family protein, partial [Deltaproteobacteria bacterium]|nr:insulinase family protein [Deltaproteobacteria bacterium]